MSGDWVTMGAEPDPPRIPPAAQSVQPSWEPGRRRVLIEAICCPSCGSLQVGRRQCEGSMAYWECRSCQNRWKEPARAEIQTVKRCVV